MSGSFEKKALIVGGGVAGIQAALDIADGGYQVILVERTPSIGGHMVQLSEVFPTLDCPQCILTPKMVMCGQHPNIDIKAYCEVESVEGEVGNFTVKIRHKATYVDWDACTGCGQCEQKCPTKAPSEFNRELAFGPRKAIYSPFAQAVPNKRVIDAEHCLKLTKDKCGICAKVCPTQAIRYDQEDWIEEVKVGAIIVATGYELYKKENLTEYATDPDVIDGLEFERILCPSGPTAGVIKRPSDGKEPLDVVFVQCAGSRDPDKHLPYCSRVCCMYCCKMAMLYKHAVPDGQAYIFYIDVRTDGKMYEEFYQRGVEEDRIVYLRGKVSKIFREGDKIIVFGMDTLTGKRVEVAADLVVLAMAMIPNPAGEKVKKILNLKTDTYGFITEAHAKLHPVETGIDGIFVAGTAQAPKDIPETVAQAGGAASKVLSLFSGVERGREVRVKEQTG